MRPLFYLFIGILLTACTSYNDDPLSESLSMQPVASKKAIRYKILPGDTANHSYVGAEDTCFNATWEVCLGKDVSRERGVDLSDIELVANSLVNLCLQAKYPKVFEKDHQTLLKG